MYMELMCQRHEGRKRKLQREKDGKAKGKKIRN
jgi:hypothetical protein